MQRAGEVCETHCNVRDHLLQFPDLRSCDLLATLRALFRPRFKRPALSQLID